MLVGIHVRTRGPASFVDPAEDLLIELGAGSSWSGWSAQLGTRDSSELPSARRGGYRVSGDPPEVTVNGRRVGGGPVDVESFARPGLPDSRIVAHNSLA